MKIARTLLTLVLLMAFGGSASAETRSTTVQASCTIPPTIHLTDRGLRSFESHPERDRQFQRTHEDRNVRGHLVRLYTLTEL